MQHNTFWCLQSEEDSEEEVVFDLQKYKAHFDRKKEVRFLRLYAKLWGDDGTHRCSTVLCLRCFINENPTVSQ